MVPPNIPHWRSDESRKINAEMAQQFASNGLASISSFVAGKKESNMLLLFAMIFRALGVAIFLCGVLQLWVFDVLAELFKMPDVSSFVVWLKVSGTGLVSGMLIWGYGEILAAIHKMVNYLRVTAEK